MTADEAIRLVERISFVGTLKFLGARVRGSPEPDTAGIKLECSLNVPDVDDEEVRMPLSIRQCVSAYALREMDIEWLFRLIETVFNSLVTHEVGESLALEGWRPRNPHGESGTRPADL